jgi:hypothetical protein
MNVPKVYGAIASVMADLAKRGISKEQTNTFDKYKFRGIDDVYNALAPILSSHGLLILPRVTERSSEERESKSGGAMFYITVAVEFDFISAEDGSSHTIRAYGEAMDRGDKGTNKAMTAAYKYACFEAFCIPVVGQEDADAEAPEVVPKSPNAGRPTDGAWEAMDAEEQAFLVRIAETMISLLDAGDAQAAHDHYVSQNLGTDEKAALWTRLDSKQRSTLKRIDAALKTKAEVPS